MKLDLHGKVMGMMAEAGPGEGRRQIRRGPLHRGKSRDEIFVADTLNWRIQKYVRGSATPMQKPGIVRGLFVGSGRTESAAGTSAAAESRCGE